MKEKHPNERNLPTALRMAVRFRLVDSDKAVSKLHGNKQAGTWDTHNSQIFYNAVSYNLNLSSTFLTQQVSTGSAQEDPELAPAGGRPLHATTVTKVANGYGRRVRAAARYQKWTLHRYVLKAHNKSKYTNIHTRTKINSQRAAGSQRDTAFAHACNADNWATRSFSNI